MFNKNNLEAYYFIDQINESTISTIFKFRNISLIYMNRDNSFSNTQDLIKIKEFSKKNNLKFYVTDNIRLAIKVKANGIYLTKNYNRILQNYNYKKDFLILGSVHNQLEYYRKSIQNCKKFFLSPIFFNKKYSINKILGVIKFKIITKDWKNEAIPLSGINQRNIKQALLANKEQIAFRSWK